MRPQPPACRLSQCETDLLPAEPGIASEGCSCHHTSSCPATLPDGQSSQI